MVKSQMTRQQCTNSSGMRGSKTGVEWEAERETKEDKEVWGSKWWMWSLPNKQTWHRDGCEDLGNVESSYQHGTSNTLQPAGERKLPYNAARTGIRYGRDALTVSMVGTVLYSRCTETTVPCSPYWTCIQYGSHAPTARKMQAPNSSWWNHKRHNNDQQEQQDNNAQTHQEWEGARQG